MDQMETVEWAGYGYAEIAFLLSELKGPSVERSKLLFDFEDAVYTPEVLAAGASSLVSRNEVIVEQDDALSTHGATQILSYALAHGNHWTQIGFTKADGTLVDSAVLVNADDLAVILQPRNLGSWLMMLQNDEISNADRLASLVSSYLETSADDVAVFIASDSTDFAGSVILRGGPGNWIMTRDNTPYWSAQKDAPLTNAEASALFAQLAEA